MFRPFPRKERIPSFIDIFEWDPHLPLTRGHIISFLCFVLGQVIIRKIVMGFIYDKSKFEMP